MWNFIYCGHAYSLIRLRFCAVTCAISVVGQRESIMLANELGILGVELVFGTQ
jgi:hypothetical protein